VGLPGLLACAAVAVKVVVIVLLNMASSAAPSLTWLIYGDIVPLWAADAAIQLLCDPRLSCFPSPAVALAHEGALLLFTGFEWFSQVSSSTGPFAAYGR
jgi:hypothetical protein